jgi:hypothetical protein
MRFPFTCKQPLWEVHLVAVPGVVVLPTVVPRVIRSAFRRAMFVVMGGIKCSVARMDRMVVSE